MNRNEQTIHTQATPVDMAKAFLRSLSMLRTRSVFFAMLWPTLVSYTLWTAIGLWCAENTVAWMMGYLPFSWLAGAAQIAATIFFWLLILVLAYLTSILFVALFILPQMLALVVGRYYPDMARMGKNALVQGAVNSVLAVFLGGLGALITSPLWFIPIAGGIIHMVFWTAWINQRTFAFDVLSEHASQNEYVFLRRRDRGAWFKLSFLLAALGFVPLLNFFVPALSALVFAHFCLESLYQLRGDAVMTVIEHDPIDQEKP